MSTVIGIDLGTTCSCVSVFKCGRLEVLTNDHNSRTTPSYVAFVDGMFIVGKEAKSQIIINPCTVVYDAKRLIGRNFEDTGLQNDMKRRPFNVVSDRGKPVVIVQNESEEKTLLPEQLSAMVLKALKKIAEEKLGESVTRAVITVPAYFTDTQRQAMKDAARIAKLNVTKLINEPTAAAIAFSAKTKCESDKNVVVYDLGGGTFDVSVLNIENGEIIVIAVSGDTHLGGRDFDCKIVDYFVDEIRCKYGVNLEDEEYRKSLAQLREKCEDVKIRLSSQRKLQATIAIDALFDGKDFKSSITRSTFNEICDELMRRTLVFVDRALNDAELRVEDIDEILLVGGSTKIPKIRHLVEEYFGKKANTSINPDEAVACGAAIQAALLQKETDETINHISLDDVTALSYGIELDAGAMCVLIKRNTPYPVRKTRVFHTTYENQPEADVEIYQGEHKNVVHNHFLGNFTVHELPLGKPGEVRILITFEIDENGILVVRAMETSTGKVGKLTVTNALKRLSEEQIEQFVLV